MEIVKQSLFLRLILSFFTSVKVKFLESALYNGLVLRLAVPALSYLDKKWGESAIAELLRRARGVLLRSGCRALFARGSALDAAAGESRVLRALGRCLNLVPDLLRRLYLRRPQLFDGSALVRLCDAGPLFVMCVLTLAMLMTPQELWNNMYSLALAFAALCMLWVSGARHPERRLSPARAGVWTLFFFAFNMLSAFWSIDFSLSYRYFFFSLTSFIVLLVLVSIIENERQLLAVVCCIASGLLVCSVCAIVQGIIGVEANPSLTDLSANADMPGRVYSFFENPNSFATVIVLFAPMCLALGFDRQRPARSAFLIVTFLLACIAIVLTFSRGGWLGLAAALFALLLMVKPRYAPVLIALACLVFPLLPDVIINRLLTLLTGDSSISTRSYLFDGAFGAIAMSPALGVGLGDAVGKAALRSGMFTAADRLSFTHSHNIYLEIWAESGVFALVFYLLATLFAISRGVLTFRAPDAPPLVRRVAVGCAAGLAGSLIFSLADHPWSYPRVMVLYWLQFAVMCAAANLNKTIKEI